MKAVGQIAGFPRETGRYYEPVRLVIESVTASSVDTARTSLHAPRAPRRPGRTGESMSDRSRDLATAVAAVRSAARACRAVQERLVRPEALEKGDKSPVTVADFASQAIICAELERALPRDPVVGEEDADTLRHEAPLLKAVVERVAEQRDAASAERVLAWIDRGPAKADS